MGLRQHRGRCSARQRHPPPRNPQEVVAEGEGNRQKWVCHREGEGEVE